jgi:hypothetical protein
MREELEAVTWDELDGMTGEEAWAALKTRIEAAVNSHVPLKPRGARGRPPWMTREIL